jgi:hypothetical protein
MIIIVVINLSNWICSVLVHRKDEQNKTDSSFFLFLLRSVLPVLYIYIYIFLRITQTTIKAHIERVGGIRDGGYHHLSVLCEYTEAKTLVIRMEREKKKKKKEEKTKKKIYAFSCCRYYVPHMYRLLVTNSRQLKSHNIQYFISWSYINEFDYVH